MSFRGRQRESMSGGSGNRKGAAPPNTTTTRNLFVPSIQPPLDSSPAVLNLENRGEHQEDTESAKGSNPIQLARNEIASNGCLLAHRKAHLSLVDQAVEDCANTNTLGAELIKIVSEAYQENLVRQRTLKTYNHLKAAAIQASENLTEADIDKITCAHKAFEPSLPEHILEASRQSFAAFSKMQTKASKFLMFSREDRLLISANHKEKTLKSPAVNGSVDRSTRISHQTHGGMHFASPSNLPHPGAQQGLSLDQPQQHQLSLPPRPKEPSPFVPNTVDREREEEYEQQLKQQTEERKEENLKLRHMMPTAKTHQLADSAPPVSQ